MIDYEKGMEVTAPCYIKNMPSDVYHAHDSISNSGLKLLSRSPAHFKYRPDDKIDKRNLTIGKALHMAMLEPHSLESVYKFTDAIDRRCKKYKEYAKERGGDFTLTESESWHVAGVRDSLWSNTATALLLSQLGHTELSGFSTDPETGVTCRHRFDKLLNSGVAIDLKTTIDARPDAFSRAIYNYNYHVQAAFYADQHEWITGIELADFIFIVVESEPPYATNIYRLSEESIQIGRETYRKALNIYASCRELDTWPAYDTNGIQEISIPQWVINQYDSKQIESFVFVED